MGDTTESIDQEIIRLYNDGDREEAFRLFISQYQAKL